MLFDRDAAIRKSITAASEGSCGRRLAFEYELSNIRCLDQAHMVLNVRETKGEESQTNSPSPLAIRQEEAQRGE
jgi:hypothetical protein